MTSSSLTATSSKFYYPWMFGRTYDLAFFFCPIVLAFACFAAIQNNLIAQGVMFMVVTNALGIGPMHQGPTWFFYLDRKNREHWLGDWQRTLIYFAGPPIVFGLSVLGSLYAPGLNYLVTTSWGVQHFVQQNFGILMLYHNKGTAEALPPRSLMLRSLWAPAFFFSAVYAWRLIFKSPQVWPAYAVIAAVGVWALFEIFIYLKELRRQTLAGAKINVPALLFWALSVFYFAPFALLSVDESTAFVVPGTLHWVQYIALNWMLVRFKYVEERKEDLPPGNPVFLMILVSLFFYGIWLAIVAAKYGDKSQMQLMNGFLIGMSNVHYYQDAFLWRFREKFQRESIMPYLLKARKDLGASSS